MAWTLVMSWSQRFKNLPAFRTKPITMNVPVNERNPNFDIYRLRLLDTNALKAQSTHWRATCSFQIIRNSWTLYRFVSSCKTFLKNEFSWTIFKAAINRWSKFVFNEENKKKNFKAFFYSYFQFYSSLKWRTNVALLTLSKLHRTLIIKTIQPGHGVIKKIRNSVAVFTSWRRGIELEPRQNNTKHVQQQKYIFNVRNK